VAEKAGLKIMALDCQVGEDWIEARSFVDVELDGGVWAIANLLSIIKRNIS